MAYPPEGIEAVQSVVPKPEPFDFEVPSPPLTKARLKEFAELELRKQVNSKPVDIGGQKFPPRKVRFVTFAGGLNADGLYHGKFRFAHVSGDDQASDKAVDFSELFETPEKPHKPPSPPTPVPVKE